MKVSNTIIQTRPNLGPIRFGEDKPADKSSQKKRELPSVLDQLPLDQAVESIAEAGTEFVIEEVVGGKGKLVKKGLDQGLPILKKIQDRVLGREDAAPDKKAESADGTTPPTQLDVITDTYGDLKKEPAALVGEAIEYIAIPIDLLLNPQGKDAEGKPIPVTRGDRMKKVPDKVKSDVGGFFGKLGKYTKQLTRLVQQESSETTNKPTEEPEKPKES